MLYVTLILSLIFTGIGFIVTENNAPYLLSGFNTLPEDEKKNVDLKTYIPFFRKFFIFAGFSTLLFTLLIYYFLNADWAGIFLAIYPLLTLIILALQTKRFWHSRTKRQQKLTSITVLSLIILIAGISVMFWYSMQDNKIEIRNKEILIHGDYGINLPANKIKSVELKERLPNISLKTNGFALQTVMKGKFRTNTGEDVLLFINTEKPPVLLITTTDNQKIYYTSKNTSVNDLYKNLKAALTKTSQPSTSVTSE